MGVNGQIAHRWLLNEEAAVEITGAANEDLATNPWADVQVWLRRQEKPTLLLFNDVLNEAVLPFAKVIHAVLAEDPLSRIESMSSPESVGRAFNLWVHYTSFERTEFGDLYERLAIRDRLVWVGQNHATYLLRCGQTIRLCVFRLFPHHWDDRDELSIRRDLQRFLRRGTMLAAISVAEPFAKRWLKELVGRFPFIQESETAIDSDQSV